MGKAQNINRRAVLVGGIASTAALSVAKGDEPVIAEGNIEAGEIMRLYRQWEAEDQLGSDPASREAEAVASWDRLRAIEHQMFTLTPESAAELAAMHIVCTARGVFLADEKFTRLTDQLVAS